ncbi:MAG: zinc-ribbon domain-containing protein [Acidobacteria bacterium]|nr:zinc-ribbon domain-containing protein [Acidobacteriota bacterium]
MKIACPKCGREYRLDPSRIPAKGARFTCWGCQAKVEVRPLQAGQGDAAVSEAPSSKDLKEHKQAISDAKAVATEPASIPQTSDREEEGFFTGPGIKKVAKSDSPIPAKEPMSAAKTAALLPSKLESSPTPPSDTSGASALKAATVKPQPLKITCPKCQHEYRIDPSRIPKGGGKFTCRNCQARIEVRPNQKAEDKASDASGQKIGTSRYQTPPLSQPTMPGAGLTANVTDQKPKVEEDLSRPGPITGPFSIKPNLKKEIESTDSEEKNETFEGESTMVMGSPSSEVKKAIQDAQEEQSKGELGLNFSDSTKETNDAPKSPNFDFSDFKKEPVEEPQTNFSFTDPNAEVKPKKEFDFSEDATPAASTIAKDSKNQKAEKPLRSKAREEVLEPPPDSTLSMSNSDIAYTIQSHTSDSTLAMSNSDIASTIQAHTKNDGEEKAPVPSFSFDFNLTEKEPKSAKVSEMEEDPNATAAIAQSSSDSDSSVQSSPSLFDIPIKVSSSEKTTPSEDDRNKTVPLSPVSTLNLSSFSEESKETPKVSFDFLSSSPPVLETPRGFVSENDLTTKKVPAVPSDLKDPSLLEEEKKPDIKIPPPPSLRSSEPKAKPVTTIEAQAKQDIVAYSPVKAESPKIEPPKIELNKPSKIETPKIETPKIETPKIELSKAEPPKKEPPKQEKREEIKTQDLPVPVYNPDIFSPPPAIEPPVSSRSGLLKGALIGATLGLLVIGYFGFFRNPTPSSSPTPSETEIVKNTPTVVETPDEPTPQPTEVSSPKATPSPKASETPKTTATPSPKATPTPKATDKPVVAGNVPDSAPGSGKFTIQVRATQSQGEAETLGKKLRNSGTEAYVVRADLGAKGIWYRVRVGRYQSFSEAQKAGSDLKSKGTVSDFIATTY